RPPSGGRGGLRAVPALPHHRPGAGPVPVRGADPAGRRPHRRGRGTVRGTAPRHRRPARGGGGRRGHGDQPAGPDAGPGEAGGDYPAGHRVRAVPLARRRPGELADRGRARPGVEDAGVQGLRGPGGAGVMSADGPTVVVGNGMAGARGAAGLRDRGRERVIVFGAETEPAYNRVLLSQVLAGKVTEPDVALLETAGRGVEVHRGHRVVAIDRAAATVTVHGPAGTGQVRYAHLVLATGSSPVIPALAGLEPAAPPDELPARVAVFRTLADCRRILAVAA